MKRLLPIALLFAAAFVWAEEIPTGYYDGINGKADEELKTALYEIIKGGDRYNYGATTYHTTNTKDHSAGDLKNQGTWGAFALTDVRSDGAIFDMYGSGTRYLPIRGQSAAGLEIEHCFPKSWWGASTKESEYQKDDAFRDLYHLNPADAIANTNKSNYGPGYVPTADKFDNGVFRMGRNAEYGDIFVFEPIDEYKGDFARAYFYIVTAYQDREWVGEALNYMDKSTYLEFKPWLQQVLVEWHRLDPVSEKEIKRIDAISSIQHNRNPYIDYPELVEYIWGDKQGEEVDLSTLTLTSSEEYELPIEHVNPTAYEAQEVSSTGFRAEWKNVGAASYELDVFSLTASGSNDTLLNVPLVKADSMKVAENIQWMKADGVTTAGYTTTDGGGAFYMSTTSEKRLFVISGLDIQENAKLIVKCSVYNKNDQTANLVVTADDAEIANIPITLDEEYHTIELPVGAQVITLQQAEIGTKKDGYHRISMQQIFVVEGDYTVDTTRVEGYPCTVEDIEAEVALQPQEAERVLYYQVTPEGMHKSNMMAVEVPAHIVTSAQQVENDSFRVLTDAASKQITVCAEKYGLHCELYNMQGQLIQARTALGSEMRLQVTETGAYILRATSGNGQLNKVVIL